MTSDRGSLAAARGSAAARRAEQLQRRIARLRAGERSTREDVELAKTSAANQRAEAVRAQERLLDAYAAAAHLRAGSSRPAPRESEPTPTAVDAAAELGVANGVLRRALVSMASSGEVKGGWSKDRRQGLWEALADQCGQESWQGWSHALCRTAVTVVPGLRGAAVSGYDDRAAPHLLAVTDEWTRRVEEIGQLVGEGPATEAHRSQVPVLVKDLKDERVRWPGYVATAAGLDLHSVYAIPVQLDGVGLASLTLYPHVQDGSGWHDWTDGFFLAAVAAKAVLADLDAVEDGWPAGDFSDDRIAIATGMVAAQLAVTVEEASARLRAFAFSNAQGLGEVAQDVLDGSLRMG
ncbi:MAG: hypothetical protein ACRYG2_24480 [Janthinobacterium lividum]